MATTIPNRFDGLPLKMLQVDGEASLKKFQGQREAHGRVLERACQIAGLSKKEAAAALDISASQLSAWFAGDPAAGHPQTWRFQQHERLGPALLLAQAEDETNVVVRHVIEVTEPQKQVG